MENKTFVARGPDYMGDGVKVWVNEDKNKNPYLSVVILGMKSIHCFKPKENAKV